MADEIKSSPEIVNEITSPLVGLEEGIDKPLQASIKKMSGMTGPSQGATVTRALPKKALVMRQILSILMAQLAVITHFVRHSRR